MHVLAASFALLALACQAPTTDAPSAPESSASAHAGAARGAGSGAQATPRGIATKPAPAGSGPRFATQRPTPAKLALLIGIQEYAPGTPAGFARLSGCIADVEGVRQLLVERFGFDPADVLVLQNEQATHENIVRAWKEWLIARAGPQTEVVYWFSGHGSQVPDASGESGAEAGGKDQTVLAWDSRSAGEDGSYDVSDDELFSLRYQLAQKTQRFLAVTDACHSASSLRGLPKGAQMHARAADAGKEPLDRRLLAGFWPEIEREWIEDGDPRRNTLPPYVHIAACTENQQALEYEWKEEDGHVETHGALTLFLSEVLREAAPGATYRQIADEAAARLTRAVAGQNPCYEGALERKLFEGTYAPLPPGFLARVQSNGRIAVQAGSLIGLAKGSELVLRGGSANELVGRALVESVWATHALACWKEAPAKEPPASMRAFEEFRAGAQASFALHVDEPEIARELARDARLSLVAEAHADAYLLARDARDGRRVLYAPGGIPVWRAKAGEELAPAAFPAALDALWRDEVRQGALENLARGTIPLRARFRAPSADELAEPELRFDRRENAQLEALASQGAHAAGEVYQAIGSGDPGKELRLVVLEVENPSDQDLYLSVISVMEDRERNVVCPSRYEGDVLLPKGGKHKVLVNATTGRDWPLDRPLRDRYLVIGTRERADFRVFEHQSTTRGGEEKLRLPEILQVGLDSLRTRGAGRAKVDVESFGLTTVDLLVRPANAAR